jgi:hypothetical protein
MHVESFTLPASKSHYYHKVTWYDGKRRVVSGGHTLESANGLARRLQASGKSPVVVQTSEVRGA